MRFLIILENLNLWNRSSNINDNEVVECEILLLLNKSICEICGVEEGIVTLVNSTCIHIMPLMNQDGFENSLEGNRGSTKGWDNDNNIDLTKLDRYRSNI